MRKRMQSLLSLGVRLSVRLSVCHIRVLYPLQTAEDIVKFLYRPYSPVILVRLDALAKALSVIATATWLGGWVAGWLGGWVSVTLRYCIKTAKPIGKLFRSSESPIILVF